MSSSSDVYEVLWSAVDVLEGLESTSLSALSLKVCSWGESVLENRGRSPAVVDAIVFLLGAAVLFLPSLPTGGGVVASIRRRLSLPLTRSLSLPRSIEVRLRALSRSMLLLLSLSLALSS